jgi:hypothetical protein
VLELLELYRQGGLASLRPIHPFPLIEDLLGKVYQFVLLFYKAKSLAFKGVYVLSPLSVHATEQKILVRIWGKGPNRLAATEGGVVKEFMKFETSSKSFKSLPVKALTSTVDAVIIEPSNNVVNGANVSPRS